MDEIRIRLASLEDAEMVLRLTSQLFTELNHLPQVAHSGELAAFCKNLFNSHEYLVLLALDPNAHAAGILTLNQGISLYAAGRFGIIREFYVVPEMRSKGVGSALLRTAKGLAKDKGWKRIEVTLPSKEDHSRTFSFYIREDFREIGPRLKYEYPYL